MQDDTAPLLTRPVRELMREVITAVTPSMRLRAASKLLSERGITGAPVVDEAWHPVGVVSRTDLLRRGPKAPVRAGTAGYYVLVHGEPLLTASIPTDDDELPDGVVGDVMTPEVLSVLVNDTIRNAVTLMVERGVHRVLVRDEGDKLVGVLSAMDVLRGLVPTVRRELDADGF